MSPVVAAAPHKLNRLPNWFGLTGMLLLATVLAAAFVQARQYALLNLTLQYQDDYQVISLHQTEMEYLRLREQLRQELDTPLSPQLQLRYDIFVSRVSLMGSDRARRLLGHSAAAEQNTASMLRDIDAFIRRADLYLGSEKRATLNPQAARSLLADLETLDAPIHQTLLGASHQVAAQLTERQVQVRQHNQIGLALTGFLLAMVTLFGLIALRQMRKLEGRRQRLEQLADQLREARIDAEAASEAKTEFLADMSHELRTPLHGLLGMLSLVRDAPRDPRAANWLLTAEESAQHLRHLLDDLLDLSKLNAGTLNLLPSTVNLLSLLREVQSLLQPAAGTKNLTLQIELDPALSACARLDATRVRQVLFNLMANAIKFSDRGSIVLACRAQADDAGQPRLTFNVADTGLGLDRDTVSRLFKRYTPVEDSRGSRQGSTGLGLAISRNLARLMGGEIVVHTAPGEGNVFSLNVPLHALPDTSLPEPTPLPTPTRPARPLQVLVAEDHPVNRQYLAALLTRLGHKSRLVNNGEEALQAMRDGPVSPRDADGSGDASAPFDLVLMDVHMPVMGGVAATTAIRALPAPACQVCVVAITADVFADTMHRCKAAGVDEILTKPLSLEVLQALLLRRFGQAGQSATSPALPGLPGLHADPARQAVLAQPASPGLLDHTTLHNVCDLMGSEQVPSLYGGFFLQAEDAARRMRVAMRDADLEALRRSAHTVKGAALNLGLPAMADAASLLSREGGSLAATHLALAIQRFEEVTAATRKLCAGEGLLQEQL